MTELKKRANTREPMSALDTSGVNAFTSPQMFNNYDILLSPQYILVYIFHNLMKSNKNEIYMVSHFNLPLKMFP